jgi:hypothetical protein
MAAPITIPIINLIILFLRGNFAFIDIIKSFKMPLIAFRDLACANTEQGINRAKANQPGNKQDCRTDADYNCRCAGDDLE